MKEPDPPLPLRGQRTQSPQRDAAYTRSIWIAGALIAALGCMAVSALLFSAWTLTDSEFSHGLSASTRPSTHPSATQPSFSPPSRNTPGKPGG